MGAGIPSGLGPMERPLSREEFMEMQERERRRRLMHERLHRSALDATSFICVLFKTIHSSIELHCACSMFSFVRVHIGRPCVLINASHENRTSDLI